MRNAPLRILAVAGLIALAAIFVLSADKPLLLQSPTLSKSQVVFAYAGDLWAVGREGGEARRLTTGTGIESDPVLLARRVPGGLHRAVRRQHGRLRRPGRRRRAPAADAPPGGRPGAGLDARRHARSSSPRRGPASRRSRACSRWPPAAASPRSCRCRAACRPRSRRTASAWPTSPPPSGSGRGSGTGAGRPRRSGSPTWPTSRWRRCRGDNSNDSNPMWVGDKVYFLSDRSGPVTLFAYDPKTKKVSAGPEERRPRLQVGLGRARRHRLRAVRRRSTSSTSARARTRPLPVTLAGDLPEVRPHFVKVGRSASPTPTSRRRAPAPCSRRGARS